MIFVTVGGQMPFERLCRAVDAWAAERGRDDVFMQIGPTDWTPSHVAWTKFLEPPDFRERLESADVIVAHAGMGSILTSLQAGKPILVMPRRGDLRETRNDHQVATAKRFLALGRVAVAMDEHELPARLDEIDALPAQERIDAHASPSLVAAVRALVHGTSET